MADYIKKENQDIIRKFIKTLNKFFLTNVIEIKRSVVMSLDLLLGTDESVAKIIGETFNLDLVIV
jgi:hypothetical protein